MKTVLIAMALVLAAGAGGADEAPPAAVPASGPITARPSPYRSPISVPSAARLEQPGLAIPPGTIKLGPTPTPTFTSTCDSSGCWGSDGTRYNAAGGMLTRPDGKVCREVAGVMQCP